VRGIRGWRPALVSLLAVMALAACGEALTTPEAVYLRAVGSMAMEPVVADLAEAFHERSPEVQLEVSGLGTRYGLEALRRGEADLALASWMPEDLEAEYLAVAVARDGLAIIVHPSNPITGLGLLQLRDLFSGRAAEWRAVGGTAAQGMVQPVSREQGSGARAAFETLVMEEYRVSPLAVLALSPPAVVEYVAAHPASIGYVSMDFVTPEVKVLKIEGELPTRESAGRASYPLTRDLWLVTEDPPSEAVQSFFDFSLGPAGQEVVGQRLGRVR